MSQKSLHVRSGSASEDSHFGDVKGSSFCLKALVKTGSFMQDFNVADILIGLRINKFGLLSFALYFQKR